MADRSGSRLGRFLERRFDAALAPVARALSGVPPNALTAAGVATGCLSGVAFWMTHLSPRYFFVGAALGAFSGVLDSLDGKVARISGRSGAAGDFLDHFGDRVVEVVALGGLAFSPYASTELGLAITIVALLNSYVGTQVESSFGHRPYSGPGKAEYVVAATIGTVSLGFFPDAAIPLDGRELPLLDLLFVALGVVASYGILHRIRLALRLAREQGGRTRTDDRFRR